MTIYFDNAYIKSSYSVIGRNENGVTINPDENINDYFIGNKCIELGESALQVKSIKGLLNKSKLKEEDINLMVSGDLQNQIFASNYTARKFNIPFLGIYSACSSYTEGLIIASVFVNNYIDNAIVTVSAHNLASEKQFRFPIEYGAIRKKVNTFTATGSVSTLINKSKTNVKVESATIGKVIDIGYSDSNNMGAAMTPGVADTLFKHLKDTKREVDYYDLILTGDLGIYGVKILKKYLKKEYGIDAKNIMDAGNVLFMESGKSIAGGSGPVCLPLVLFDKVLKDNKYKRILLLGSGSLHTKLSTNISESIPSISHVVSLEVI